MEGSSPTEGTYTIFLADLQFFIFFKMSPWRRLVIFFKIHFTTSFTQWKDYLNMVWKLFAVDPPITLFYMRCYVTAWP